MRKINTDEILIGNFIHDRSRIIYIEHTQYTDYQVDAWVKRLRYVKNEILRKWKGE